MTKIVISDNKNNPNHKSNQHWKFEFPPDLLHPEKRLETGVEKQRKNVTINHL
jgi:hypothetical protein